MTTYDQIKQWENNMQQHTPVTVSEKEESIYQELLALYRDCPTGNERCYDLTILDIFNGVIDQLIHLGHQEYLTHKITTEGEVVAGKYVHYSNLRMKIYRTIRKMYSDLGMIDPEIVLNQHSKPGTPHYQNNPIIFHENHMSQNQSQEQKQTQTMTIEQSLNQLQNIVDTQLDEEEVEQIREVLEKFKQKPGVWSYAKQLIGVGVGFSRDIAVQFIGSVLAAAALASR